MALYNVIEKTEEYAPQIDPDQFYSVEILINKLGVIYQYRVWRTEELRLYILVKEDSAILPWLQKEDRLNMKLYSNDLMNPYQNHETEICFNNRQRYGRLRGHYLVGFEIVENKTTAKNDWSYVLDENRDNSYNALLRNV